MSDYKYKRWGRYRSGFELSEILLVTAILSAITIVTAPLYQSFQVTTEVNAASDTLIQDLYQAQVNSRGEVQDSGWGVAINGSNITLFSGASYSSRNTAYDSTYTVPGAVSLKQTNEIDYSKLIGLPQSSSTFTVNGGGKSYTITVNAKGMVDY